MLTDWVLSNVDGQTAFLIAVILLFLFVGLFLEGIAAMLVLVPILHPIAVSLGIDPVHFGILVIFNLMIGLITPPLGLCLFVAEGVAQVGMAKLTPRDPAVLCGRSSGAVDPHLRARNGDLAADRAWLLMKYPRAHLGPGVCPIGVPRDEDLDCHRLDFRQLPGKTRCHRQGGL